MRLCSVLYDTTFCIELSHVIIIFFLIIKFQLDLMERNEESFLSAGEMPEPTLYLTWSIIYFLAAISWMYILRTSK
jgi:hypothetical protein